MEAVEKDLLPSAPRLDFKLLRHEQLALFYNLALDPHVRKFLMEGQEMTEEECYNLISSSEAIHARTGLGLYLVYAGGKLIGYAGFMNTHPPSSDVDIIFAFAKDHTRQGFGSEACEALVKYFRSSKFADSLMAVVHPKNTASIKILEKNHFAREGSAGGDLGHLFQYRLTGGSF
jgi:ribosomal-protein-alanine N-acetyltransferase